MNDFDESSFYDKEDWEIEDESNIMDGEIPVDLSKIKIRWPEIDMLGKTNTPDWMYLKAHQTMYEQLVAEAEATWQWAQWNYGEPGQSVKGSKRRWWSKRQ